MTYDDPDTLRRLYHDEDLSIHEMGDELECSTSTVHKYMKWYDVERRPPTSERPPHFGTHNPHGHEFVQTKVDGETKRVLIHRLIAVAEHGFDAVEGKVVHHASGVPWDNRPSNLELIDQSEHIRRHGVSPDSVERDIDTGRFV